MTTWDCGRLRMSTGVYGKSVDGASEATPQWTGSRRKGSVPTPQSLGDPVAGIPRLELMPPRLGDDLVRLASIWLPTVGQLPRRDGSSRPL